MSNPIITNKLIESFNPCKSGIDNFNEYYPNYKNKLSKLLALDNIPYSDKIWLACKVVDIAILNQWSVECAEKVLDNYNKVYPNDDRISNCIKITKKYLLGKASKKELSAALSAAWSAARSAARSAAESAAESAAWSAASAALSAARSAARLAAESARLAAWSAARSAAASARSGEENLNLSILIALLENE